jgi:hypothetical protein
MRVTFLLVVRSIMALALSASSAAAQVAPSEPMAPEAREAVEKILEARRAEGRRSDVHSQIGLALRELRTSLREVLGHPDGTAEASKAKAAATRLRVLVAEARTLPAGDRLTTEQLNALDRRAALLIERTSEVETLSGASRRERAREILTELDVNQPRSERLDPGTRRESAWRTLPKTGSER